MGQLLLINAGLLLLYMTGWFALARQRNRLDVVDTAWGLGFVLVAISTVVQAYSTHSLLIAVLVSIWGVRLARHISKRSKGRSGDPRYDAVASKWKGNYWLTAYYSIFLLQGVLIFIVSLPVSLAAGRQLDGWAWLSVAGAVLWLIGFACEAIADQQLAAFLQDKNHGKVLDTGLWHYSRHPNYFGEITQWWAIGSIASQAAYGWIGFIGPLALTLVIVFVSGIPPIEKRRLKDAEYRAYQQRTSPLIPLPPKHPL